jgi:D-alanyl-D-alanine carboxypeptidase (penicillin-binding protein 5/6)
MSLFKQDEILHSIPVWKGKENVLPIVSHDSGMIIVPEAYKNDVKTEERLPAYVIAPIHQNQEIGQYIVNVHGKVVKSIPLMASVDIQRAGIFKVVYHNMYLLGKGKTLLFVLGVALALVFAFVILSFLGRRRRRSRLRVRL